MRQWVNRELAWVLFGQRHFSCRRWPGFCGVLFALLCFGLVGKTVDAQTVNSDAEVVYLDAQGYIRVYDYVYTNTPAVQWVSPVGGWVDFALGDLNGDGDSEIVAVKGTAGSGRLTVYDPVITAGAIVPNQLINGIPWRILYDSAVTGVPYLVATGELDAGVAGAEIIYGALLNTEDEDDTNDEATLIVLHATDGVGSAWTPIAQYTTSTSQPIQITVGNLDGAAPDEVALVDKEGALDVYRLSAPTFTRIFNNESESRPWKTTTIARFFSVGPPGLAASRSASPGSASFWVFVYDPKEEGAFRDAYDEFFLPAPDQLFAGDINGNGDEEIFFLRTVPSTVANLPRLVMRNRGTDTLPLFEQPLDADNGYGGGTAGDVDGDGRAEIVVMRNDKLRIFTQPELNATFTDFTPPAVTNARTIRSGNLDRSGYVKTPSFSVTPTKLEGDLTAGSQSALGAFSITNGGEGGSIPFSIRSQGNPTWLRLTGVTGQTPATFTAAFDARLLTAGVYTTTIIIESSNSQVNNAPFPIAVKLTVRPGLAPRSLGILANASSCAADAPNLEVPLVIDGPTGMTFVAKIIDAAAETRSGGAGIEWPSAVPWVSAQSTNSAPTTMQLTFRPQQLPSPLVKATLELTAADERGVQVRRVPLILLCTQTQIYLPIAAR